MYRHLKVRVSFKGNLDPINGLVYVEDYNASNKPRSFIIEVNKKDPEEEIVKTLAHEVVHIYQYAYGELNEEMSLWKGKKVDQSKIDYFEQPWEKEAAEVGEFLYESYILGNTK